MCADASQGRTSDCCWYASRNRVATRCSRELHDVDPAADHRDGRITLRPHQVERLSLPRINQQIIRSTRERLHMSRPAFACRIGVNPRALARWEQGRSKPNDQAAALILLVRKYPDTLERLQHLAAAAWRDPEFSRVDARRATIDSVRARGAIVVSRDTISECQGSFGNW